MCRYYSKHFEVSLAVENPDYHNYICENVLHSTYTQYRHKSIL